MLEFTRFQRVSTNDYGNTYAATRITLTEYNEFKRENTIKRRLKGKNTNGHKSKMYNADKYKKKTFVLNNFKLNHQHWYR